MSDVFEVRANVGAGSVSDVFDVRTNVGAGSVSDVFNGRAESDHGYAEQERASQEKQLCRRAKELGFQVVKAPPPEVEAASTDAPVSAMA